MFFLLTGCVCVGVFIKQKRYVYLSILKHISTLFSFAYLCMKSLRHSCTLEGIRMVSTRIYIEGKLILRC